MSFINLSIHVGKYEPGKTLGKGAFAKVKIARNMDNGVIIATKVGKEMIYRYKTIGKIKREISSMKLLSHLYVVQMHEIMAIEKKLSCIRICAL
jgi:5'-AMP-activated protein kinase catalytic alpha subunit